MEFVRLDSDDPGTEDIEGPAAWLGHDAVEPRPSAAGTERKRGAASSVLMAAMLGLVDALGWERPKDDTVEVVNAPIGDDGLILDYRHLEPLE